MKYAEIQTALLKDVLKDRGSLWYTSEYKDSCAISDGKAIWLIPRDKFILDIEKLAKGGVKTINVDRMFQDADNYSIGVPTGNCRKMNNGKSCVQIKSSQGECYVQESYLKWFDKPMFRMYGERDSVFIYETQELVGLVMPYHFKDGE